MKDQTDNKTRDLLTTPTKAQRFREKQLAAGKKQYSFWLTPIEAIAVKGFINGYLSEPKEK